MKQPEATVIIPNYNGQRTLASCLQALKRQTDTDFEIVVVDDGSTDGSKGIAEKYADRVLSTGRNSGPATARNIGIKNAQGKLILLTDADCVPANDWVAQLKKNLKIDGVAVVMGRVEMGKSTFLGEAISALGYPAGGSIGFEKIWPVTPEGYTITFSSCNCGMKKEVFDRYSYFDEGFPMAGGEDTLLAKVINEGGGRITYCPSAVVKHEARSDLKSFIKWQINRGRCIYLFKRKAGAIGGNVKNRLWAIKNVIINSMLDAKILLILPLLLLSLACQQIGYFQGVIHDRAK